MMYYDNFFGFGIFGGIFMVIFMFLFWAGIVYLIVWAIRSFVSDSHENTTAEEILRQRYAKGEINKEEFESKMRDLKNHNH